MQTFSHVILCEQGLHARPCTDIAVMCLEFSSQVVMEYMDTTYPATNPISLMAANAGKNAEITFHISGENEEKEAAQLKTFIKKILSENS